MIIQTVDLITDKKSISANLKRFKIKMVFVLLEI